MPLALYRSLTLALLPIFAPIHDVKYACQHSGVRHEHHAYVCF